MEDCLFCKIIKGEIPSKKLYEDDKVFVFLDINPSTTGHMLIIPKNHFVTIDDIDMDTLTYIYEIIRERLIPLVKDKLNAKGLTIVQNNGEGQEVKHIHFHLIPRYEDDELRIHSNQDIIKELDEVFEILN